MQELPQQTSAAGRSFYETIPDNWLTIDQAAAALGLSPSAVRKARPRIHGAVKRPLHGGRTEGWLLPIDSLREHWPDRDLILPGAAASAAAAPVAPAADTSAEISRMEAHIATLTDVIATLTATNTELAAALKASNRQLEAGPQPASTPAPAEPPPPPRQEPAPQEPTQLSLLAKARAFRLRR